MFRKFIIVSLMAFSGTLIAASSFSAPENRADAFYYFRLMWHTDSMTTATIGWSSASSANAKVYFDTIDHGTEITKYGQSQAVDASNVNYNMKNSFVRLKNLKPGSNYYFVVSDGKSTSKRFWFQTLSNTTEPLSVIAGGDSRNNATARRNANLLAAKLRPHVIMFGGDMVASGTEAEWKEWMTDWQLTHSPDGKMIPVIITRGNHEKNNDILVNLFDTNKTVYYATTLGANLVRVYTLNSESAIAGAQTDWLKKDLEANAAGAVWKFAQYHRPMRPHTSGKSDLAQAYTYWAPLFYKHGVKLVSEADAHTVKITWPVKPTQEKGSAEGFIRDDKDGITFIGEGCWGAPLRSNNDNKPWTRNSGKFNSFNRIIVDRSKLEIQTLNVDNAGKVEWLTDDNRFANPKNLNVWSPSNGPVATIQ